MDITSAMLNALSIGVDDGREIENGMVSKMSKNYFKYVLERGGGHLYTPVDLNWFQRFMYRLSGHKVTKITDGYFDDVRNDNKKTTVSLEIKF
jgi:hypothetical protein